MYIDESLPSSTVKLFPDESMLNSDVSISVVPSDVYKRQGMGQGQYNLEQLPLN